MTGPRAESVTSLPGVLARWKRWMTASARSPATIELRLWHVRHVLEAIGSIGDPWAVTTTQLVDFLAAQRWKPATRRSYRASLRVFYGWARDVGLLEVSPAHALPPVKTPRARPRPASESAWRSAKAGAPKDILIGILLAGRCGLRRGEIARSRREDLEEDLVGHAMRVIGKGGHERLVPVPDQLAAMILSRPAGWLFPSPRRPGQHLTPEWVGKYISRHLPDGVTTHNLRHRCATIALEQTKDLRAVQELLGHASPDTTAIYTLIADRRVRAAMEAAA